MFTFWKQFWKLSKKVHKAMISVFLLILVIEVLRLMTPYVMKVMIDFTTKHHQEILGNQQLQRQFMLYGAVFVGSFFIMRCLGIWKNWLLWRHTVIDNIDVEYKESNQQLLELPLSYHEGEGAGQKAKRTHRGIDRMTKMYENLAYSFIPAMFETAAGFVPIFMYEPQAAMILLAALVIHILLSNRVMQIVSPLHLEEYLKDQAIAGKMTEAMVNVNSVQVHDMENHFCAQHNERVTAMTKVSYRINGIYNRYDLYRNINISLAALATFALTSRNLLDGGLSVGDWTLCLWLYVRILERMFELTQIQQVIAECETPIKKLYELMQEPVVRDAGDALPWPVEAAEENYIVAEKVSFAYPSQQTLIVNGNGKQKKLATSLAEVSLSIPRQKFIGVLGPTGSGKSTFIKLLMLQYNPMHGEIRVHGVPLQRLRRSDWRQRIGYVPQEVGIFSGTVMENIKMFSPGLSNEEAIEMAQLCHAHEFISELPQGYDTAVGEFGFKLSGGQRQLLGIVRAMCRRPELLILDEATSSLDSESEGKVQEAIEALRAQQLCTVVAIAHRLSTVQKADRLFILHKGRLVASGTHEELLAEDGLYALLWRKQHEKGQVVRAA